MKIPNSVYIDSPTHPLLQGLISYWDVTDANGSALGITLVCGNLANEPSYDGLPVKILSGPAAGQVRTIAVHAGNTLTVGVAFSNAAGAVQQIVSGTLFVIISSLGGGGSPGPAPTEGLSYYGVVDAVPGANQFTIGGLAGLGAGKFDGATNPYYAFVLRDAGGAGAAPQGEQQAITAYTTATGVFTTAAFTAAAAAGDEILIVNPALAATIIILAGLAVPVANAVTNALMRDVTGNKTSTAIYAKTDTADIIRYVKGLMDAGIAIAGTVVDVGPAVTDFDTSLAEVTNNHYNGGLLLFLNGPNVGQYHLIDIYTGANGNVSFAASDQWTDIPANGNSFLLIPNNGAYLKKIFTAIGALAAAAILHEQADVNINDVTGIAPLVFNIFNLAAANTRYVVRSLRIKCANPGANTITVRLWELINGGMLEVDSFVIDNTNFGTYHSLMDMFGLPQLAGDQLLVTIESTVAAYAVTGQYSFATATI